MGNENSSTARNNPNTTKPGLQRKLVAGPLHPDYQPPVADDNRNDDPAMQSKLRIIQEPVPSSSRSKQMTPWMSAQRSGSNVNKEYSSPMPSKKSVTLAPTRDQSFAVLSQRPVSSVIEDQRMSSPSFDTPLPYNTTSSSNAVTSGSLEKAPLIKLNYVAKPSNNKSMHTYEPGDITVMSRTSSQTIPHGNRWYDNNYNKSVKPVIDKYL